MNFENNFQPDNQTQVNPPLSAEKDLTQESPEEFTFEQVKKFLAEEQGAAFMELEIDPGSPITGLQRYAQWAQNNYDFSSPTGGVDDYQIENVTEALNELPEYVAKLQELLERLKNIS